VVQRRRGPSPPRTASLRQPGKAEVMWQFSEAIDGIGEAARVARRLLVGTSASIQTQANRSFPRRYWRPRVLQDASRVLNCFSQPGTSSPLDGSGTRIFRTESADENLSSLRFGEFSSSEYSKTIAGSRREPSLDSRPKNASSIGLVALASEARATATTSVMGASGHACRILFASLLFLRLLL